jgi:hypothetical protein
MLDNDRNTEERTATRPPAVTTTLEHDAVQVTFGADGEPTAAEVCVAVDTDVDGFGGEWAVVQVRFDIDDGVATPAELDTIHRDAVPAFGLAALPVAAATLREDYVFDRVVDSQRYLRDLFAGDGGGADG